MKHKKEVEVTPEFLASRGYSISRAARAAGVCHSHLAKVLKGERKGSADLMARLRNLPAYHPIKAFVSY